MVAFQVQDMTCGHCVSAITKAVKAADDRASVSVDLASHRVEIESTQADAQQLSDAIRDAGYTPVALATAQSGPAPDPQAGCCCG